MEGTQLKKPRKLLLKAAAGDPNRLNDGWFSKLGRS